MLLRLVLYALCAVSLFCPITANASPVGAVLDIACAPTAPDVAAVVTEGAVSVTLDCGRSFRVLPSLRIERSGDGANASPGDSVATAEAAIDGAIDEGGVSPDGVDSALSSAEVVDSFASRAPPSPQAAVNDLGGTAWWRDGVIYTARLNSGGWRRLNISGVRDAIFDASGRLYVLTDSALAVYSPEVDGGQFESVVSLQGGISLFRGPAGTVRLLARDGIYGAERDATLRLTRRLALGEGRAACLLFRGDDTPESWAAAVSGSVFGVTAEGERLSEWAFSASALAVRSGMGGEIRFLDSRGGWRRFKDGRFQSLSWTVTEVDAAGRFWSGGPDGAVPPEAGVRAVGRGYREPPEAVPIPTGFAIAHPVPPRCRRYRIGLLPDVHVGASYRRWERQQLSGDGGRAAQAVLTLGIFLTWRAGEMDMDACLARRERFQVEAVARIRRTAERRASHRAARNRSSMETSLRAQIALHCETARTAALLGLTGSSR